MNIRTQLIKKIARPLGITTGEIAKQLHITFSTLKKFAKTPDLHTIQKIQEIFGVEIKKTS